MHSVLGNGKWHSEGWLVFSAHTYVHKLHMYICTTCPESQNTKQQVSQWITRASFSCGR